MSDQEAVNVTTTAEVEAVPRTDPFGRGAGDDAGIEDFGELPGRPLRKRMGPLTYLLLGALVVCAAFYGGAVYGKSEGTSGSTSGTPAGLVSRLNTSTGGRSPGASSSNGSSGSPSSRSRGAGGGSFPGAGGAVSGAIKLITGNNFYVKESDGTVVKVTTSPGTAITITSSGSVSQLHPGDNVTVLGSNKNGTVSANRVVDSGSQGSSGPVVVGPAQSGPVKSGSAGSGQTGSGSAGSGSQTRGGLTQRSG